MKLQDLKPLQEAGRVDNNDPAWYVVNLKDDAIAAGPFPTKPGSSQLSQYQWYKPNGYSVEYGIVDEAFTEYDKFKAVDEEEEEEEVDFSKEFHAVKDANPNKNPLQLWNSKEMKQLCAKHGEKKVRSEFDDWVANY